MTVPAVFWGAVTQPQTQAAQDAWEAKVGRKMSIGCQSTSWATGKNTDGTYRYNYLTGWLTDSFKRHHAAGRLVCFTWNSWDLNNQTDLAFNLPSILSGRHDAYLHTIARQFKALGVPVLIRFNSEMNGWWWILWSEIDRAGNPLGGNQKGQFVQAWRHVVDIFRQEAADNVMWFWCANAMASPGSLEPTSVDLIPRFFPGEEYCHVVGLDSYNRSSLTFTQILRGGGGSGLGDAYGAIVKLAPNRPFAIGEFETHDSPVDKTAWLQDAFTRIPRDFPQIRYVMPYDAPDPTYHWEITADNGQGIRRGLDSSLSWVDAGKFELPALGRPWPSWWSVTGPDLLPELRQALAVSTSLSSDLSTALIDRDTARRALVQAQTDLQTTQTALEQARADIATEIDRVQVQSDERRKLLEQIQSHVSAVTQFGGQPLP